MNYDFSLHALAQIKIRNIPMDLVKQVIEHPEQVESQGDLDIHQSVVEFPSGKNFLLRVFIGKATVVRVVITVYKTSQIKKYWL